MRSTRRALLGASCFGTLALALPGAAQLPTPQPLPGERMLGRADAPVTVIEFHSLTCGNCARFHTEVLPRIKAEFIDTGLVRMVLRDFPLDRTALDAAAMVHCAGPEKFEPMLGLLYTQKEAWAHAPDARVALRRYAALAGVPAARLEACWADRAFWEPIAQSRLNAEREFGINATPSFIIDGQVHRGVLEFDRFAALVRPLLPPRTGG
jgi:protein-disulfide isomerase